MQSNLTFHWGIKTELQLLFVTVPQFPANLKNKAFKNFIPTQKSCYPRSTTQVTPLLTKKTNASTLLNFKEKFPPSQLKLMLTVFPMFCSLNCLIKNRSKVGSFTFLLSFAVFPELKPNRTEQCSKKHFKKRVDWEYFVLPSTAPLEHFSTRMLCH